MSRTRRDKAAERAAIVAAADRLLVGTPLRSASGKLTVTELIAESALRRDVVYEHTDLVDQFKAQAKARHSTPTAMQILTDKCAGLETDLASIKSSLAEERRTNSLLRKALAEMSLELQQTGQELEGATGATSLSQWRAHR